MKTTLEKRLRRHRRIRMKITGTSKRPRLAVFRSNRFIYAQLIDDVKRQTLASTDDKTLVEKKAIKDQAFAKVNRANLAGQALAKLALAKKIKQVTFDRGGYRFTGRVKALAEGARAGGLEF
ncbi:MAG: 50S ribosomal protein L18 [Candidatus Vogelbacteria bacterium CG22_combo_CG10-13_8_21_14_all_37_9]|uniref:Large ribosomal subunit protein uL18 n=1 Tax=Candidatus Vogelbacteria bacterium CG22_combo_CG10-13_8_21_14_all_37_9 TaxID=1975046 RepID=A0A2H0BMG3_9BACT|nr:MAG: 50S ribosomal protein L18 [bacterium CG10_37_50]PIP58178.1 MAG: 50S ribosomal protein L18 [Candidatus Vogelbacteria bacterium CG22_combo_CG10-13_8_21_14_all_37_9]